MTDRLDWSDGPLHLGVGIEDTFIPQQGPGHRRLDEYELTQHYSRWRDDLDLVAASGARFLRWGVPWYLVEPRPGEFDWSWVDQVAERMGELGLHCVVDLMHYGTPLWLDNAFLNAAYPERVAGYARAVADRYRGVWTDFTPLNEPVVNADWCGQRAAWPPYLTGQDGFVKVLVAVARGMVRTQQEIAATLPDARFVHVDAGFLWQGETSPLPRTLLEERRFLALDLITGRVDERSPIHPYLVEHGVGEDELAWFRANAVTPDVIGVNYYPTFSTSTLVDGVTAPVWAGTAGLREIVTAYADRYRRPVAVTETSLVGTPEEKTAWLRESVSELEALRREGHDVVGHTWFPFFTLVDWQYRFEHGTPDDHFKEFGLVDLRRGADLGLTRVPNEAFTVYQQLCRSR